MATDEFAKVVRAVAAFDETVVDLSAITVPTPVLYGEHGAAFVRRHAERLSAELPAVRVLAVPGAGHTSNPDAPEFVTGALREFLGRAVSRNTLESTDG